MADGKPDEPPAPEGEKNASNQSGGTWDEDDKQLGPEGEKALKIWKDRAKTAEQEAKRAKDLEAQLVELQAANMTEQEKALESARKEAADAARKEAMGSVERRLFAAEVKAAVAGKVIDPDMFSDPDVAMRLLKIDTIPVTETGDIDSEAISLKLDSLLESKKYLAATGATRPAGQADQGARTTPEAKGLAEQISEAEAKGDWNTARRLKLIKAAQTA